MRRGVGERRDGVKKGGSEDISWGKGRIGKGRAGEERSGGKEE